MVKATMYSTPTCTHCKNAKKYLKELGISVKDIDISRDQRAAEQMVHKTGQMGVPVIMLKGATIVGFDKEKIKRILNVN